MRDYTFAIVVDSCSDLSKQLREKYDILYAKMGIVRNVDGADTIIPASLDWDLYTNKQLNDWLRDGEKLKTSLVTYEEFDQVFGDILAEGKDILYLACSNKLSGTYNLSLMVADDLLKKHPDRKIVCIDTLTSGLAQGSMAIDASVMREEGKTIDQIAEYVAKNKHRYHQYATVETLEYLKRSGRIKPSTAFFGNIIGVKPILYSDLEGQNVSLKKIKGRKKSLAEIVAISKELILDAQNQTVYISHGDCLEDAEYVKQLVIEQIAPKNVEIAYLGPMVGISTGPGSVMIYVKGKQAEI